MANPAPVLSTEALYELIGECACTDEGSPVPVAAETLLALLNVMLHVDVLRQHPKCNALLCLLTYERANLSVLREEHEGEAKQKREVFDLVVDLLQPKQSERPAPPSERPKLRLIGGRHG